jgi:hypothetical protein
MVQVPAAISVAVEPETVQIADVLDVKLTGRPELAVAVKLSDVPAVWLAMTPKEICWLESTGDWLCGVDPPPHPATNNEQASNPMLHTARTPEKLACELVHGIATGYLSQEGLLSIPSRSMRRRWVWIGTNLMAKTRPGRSPICLPA